MNIKKSDFIVFFIFSLNGGGAAKILLRIAEKYSQVTTIRILTIEPPSGTYDIPKNLEILTLDLTGFSILPKSLSHYLSIIFSLRRYLKIHAPKKMVSFIHIANILSVFATFGLKTEAIVCERSDLQKTRIGLWWKIVRPFAYYFSEKIIIQNEADKNIIPDFLRSKTFVARNPMPDKLETIKQKRNRIISVGRLHPVKRYDYLINIMEPILKDNPDTEFWICGEGPLKKELLELIDRKSLNNQVKLMGHQSNVQQLVAESLIFLMSSESEGQPNAMIEALVQGIPSVCFDTSPCFTELANFFPDTYLIPDGKDSLYIQTVKSLLSKMDYQKIGRTEKMQLLNKWNDLAYLQWDSAIL